MKRNKIFKVNSWRIAFVLILLFFLPVACSNPFGSSKKDYDFNPMDNEEAELIALCLSGNITAPDSLYNQVLAELKAIRSRYGEEFSQLNSIRFRTPWVQSCIIIGFESGTAQLVAKGEYHAWDELNNQYQMTEVNLSSIRNDWVLLSFKGRLHPRRLSELYSKLPGVRYAQPNHIISIYPLSNIYPRQTSSGVTYLFCTGGAPGEVALYWYFVAYPSGAAVLLGHWNPQESPQEPNWWPEAKLNIEQYYKF